MDCGAFNDIECKDIERGSGGSARFGLGFLRLQWPIY
jgi:hypothetical protein